MPLQSECFRHPGPKIRPNKWCPPIHHKHRIKTNLSHFLTKHDKTHPEAKVSEYHLCTFYSVRL